MISVLVGGPAYRYLSDDRRAKCLYELGAALGRHGILAAGYHTLHGNPVEIPRNDLMQIALEAEDVTQLLWVDSDVWWYPEDESKVIEVIRMSSERGLPFIGFPVEQWRGITPMLNVYRASIDQRYELEELEDICRDLQSPTCPVAAMGLGMQVFNLGIYRKHWPVDDYPWFRTAWLEGGEDYRPQLISEDVWHTSQIERRMGYPPHCYPALVPHHGEKRGPRHR